MKKYELMLVITAEKAEADVKKVVKSVTDYLSSKKAKNVKEDYWGKRNLAYPIQKNTEGYYTVLNFELDSKEVVGLKEQLKMNDDIIRHLATVVD